MKYYPFMSFEPYVKIITSNNTERMREKSITA
jgi:hypothetical protein